MSVWRVSVWRSCSRGVLVALLLIWTAPAFAADIKIATWNLDWLTARADGDPELPADVHPKVASDLALLQGYAAILDADVVALQEVDGPGIAAALFPPDRYTLFFTDDHVIQRVGIAVRRGIRAHRNPDVTALDLYPDAHFHLRSGLDLTLDLPSGPLRLLAVHLKTGCHFDHLATSTRRSARPCVTRCRSCSAGSRSAGRKASRSC